MLVIASDFIPKDRFSPTALKLDRECPTAYFLRYAMGYREPELAWANLPPEPDKKDKAAHREWVRRRRPALGTECHARLECYYKGGDVDWHDVPGRTVLAGLHHLPHPDKCRTIETETSITIDLSWLHAEFPQLVDDPLQFEGTRDLVVEDVHGHWLLIDHKTTYTFEFYDREKTKRTVKSVDELRADEQANLYGLDVMQKRNLRALDCRWVYYRTEDTPDARAVDFFITIEEAQAVVRRLVIRALDLRARMRRLTSGKPRPLQEILQLVEKNFDQCSGYGGCPHKADNGHGGQCFAVESTGAQLVRLRKKQSAAPKIRAELPPREKPKTKARAMSFRKAAEAAGVTKPGTTPAAKPAADPPPAATESPAEPPAETAPDSPPPAAEPQAKPAGARRGPKPKGAPEGMTVTLDGYSVALPPDSPLAVACVKVIDASKALEAALAGE